MSSSCIQCLCPHVDICYIRVLSTQALVDVDETFRKPPIGEVASHQKSLSISEVK